MIKTPNDFKGKVWNSILKNSECETIFSNIMKILSKTGNEWRELSWDEYKQVRLEDGYFSESEKSYFNKVLKYTVNEEMAKEFEAGQDEYAKKYKGNLEKIYFYRLKGYYRGYIFKDIEKLEKVKEEVRNYYTNTRLLPELNPDAKYELIEIPICKYSKKWKMHGEWDATKYHTWFMRADVYLYDSYTFSNEKDTRKKYRHISTYLLAMIQENDFIEFEFGNGYWFTED